MRTLGIAFVCTISAFAIGSTQAIQAREPVASSASTASQIKSLNKKINALTRRMNATAALTVRSFRSTDWHVSPTYTDVNGGASTRAYCPAGTKVTGGGGAFTADTRNGDRINDSHPIVNGWQAGGLSYAAVAGRLFEAFVVCAKD